MTALHWHCDSTGLPGDTCDATGDSAASAERHQRDTGHGTNTHMAAWKTCPGVGK